MRMLVPTGDQSGWDRSVQASTTTGRFVAQERMKLNRVASASVRRAGIIAEVLDVGAICDQERAATTSASVSLG